MTTTTLPPLLRAATSTFESLALLVAEPAAASDASAATPHAVSVAFAGPVRGRLVLRVSDDVRAALAENMLGASGPSPALQADALGEVANVVCGNLLPALAGRAAVFHLAAPRHLESDRALAPLAGERCEAVVALAVETGRAELALMLADGDAFAHASSGGIA